MPAESRASVPPRYELIEIDIIGFEPNADTQGRFGINNRGEIAYTKKSGASSRAMLYLPSPAYGFDLSQSSTINVTDVFGTITIPEEDGFLYGPSYARDISDRGFIVGQFGGVDRFEGTAFVIDLADHFGWTNRSLAWRPTEAPSPCVGLWARAMAVTGGTDPVVVVETGASRVCLNYVCYPGDLQQGPPVYMCFSMAGALSALGSGPVWQSLGDIDCPCDEGSFPFASTFAFDAERAMATSSVLYAGFGGKSGTEPDGLICNAEQQDPCLDCAEAVRWNPVPEALQPIGSLRSVARGVNRAGDAVGYGLVSGSPPETCKENATFWQADGTVVTNLHYSVSTVAARSRAESVNRFGALSQVVGWDPEFDNPLLWTRNSSAQWNGWVLQVGGSSPNHAVIECDDCKDGEGNVMVNLRQAFDINDEGWIIAWGERGDPGSIGTSAYRLYLLKPIDVCGRQGDFDQSCEVDLADLLFLLAAWGDCEVDWCPSDFNGDGQVDFADLVVLLGNWGPCDAPPVGLPQSVEDCIQRVGLDPAALSACLSAIP